MSKLEQAKKIVAQEAMYSSTHIRLNPYNNKYYLADRWYGSYEPPDWTTHFHLTDEEAEEIVQAGVADYWLKCGPRKT